MLQKIVKTNKHECHGGFIIEIEKNPFILNFFQFLFFQFFRYDESRNTEK